MNDKSRQVSKDVARLQNVMLNLCAERIQAIKALFAAQARDKVMSRPAVLAMLRRLFAGAFVLLGLRLALADQR